MVDFGELWRMEAPKRRKPDNAAAWDERARDEVSKFSPSEYSQAFLELASLQPGESVFDMGCGAGALAAPCAASGHRVLAADFSSVMLERCRQAIPSDASALVETRLLAWDDDWHAAGMTDKAYDVAFASRSLATADMEAAICKLSAVARRKVCATVVAGSSPRISGAMFADLGFVCRGHQDAAFVFGIATQLGYRPEVRFLETTRIDAFESEDAALQSYQNMVRFADGLDEAGQADARLRVADWVHAHLAQRDQCGEPFSISAPRTFSWAFISWEL